MTFEELKAKGYHVVIVYEEPPTREERAKIILDALMAPAAEISEGLPLRGDVIEWKGFKFVERK